MIWVLLTLIGLSSVALADGGTVALRAEAPPYLITVFSSPVPLRAGIADLSVLVQEMATRAPVRDVHVSLIVEDHEIPAELGRGQNKLLYSAQVDLKPGSLPYEIRIGPTSVRGVLTVQPAETPARVPYGYIAPVPICIAVFAISRLHRSKKMQSRASSIRT